MCSVLCVVNVYVRDVCVCVCAHMLRCATICFSMLCFIFSLSVFSRSVLSDSL